MRTKAPGPDELLPPGEGTDPVLAAYFRVTRLKRLFRQGWLKRGVEEAVCESVADHSFGVAMLALLAPAGDLDRGRAMLLALVHELGETYAGDITPVDGIAPEEKSRREREALLRALEGHPEASSFLALWEEFEAGSSPEARFVRELDRLEMGLQAAVHEAEGSLRMEEFYDSARRAVASPGLRALLERAVAEAGQARLAGRPPLARSPREV